MECFDQKSSFQSRTKINVKILSCTLFLKTRLAGEPHKLNIAKSLITRVLFCKLHWITKIQCSFKKFNRKYKETFKILSKFIDFTGVYASLGHPLVDAKQVNSLYV